MAVGLWKKKHYVLLGLAAVLLSACGVNTESVAAEINQSIQVNDMPAAVEVYDTTVDKLGENPDSLSSLHEEMGTVFSEGMETAYKEVLADYSKVETFAAYLNKINDFELDSSAFRKKWLSYDKKVADVRAYNKLQALEVDAEPKKALEFVKAIDKEGDFYDKIAEELETLELQANEALEQELLTDFYGVWLYEGITYASSDALIIFRPDSYTYISLYDISNLDANTELSKEDNIRNYVFTDLFPTQDTLKLKVLGGQKEVVTTYTFLSDDRKKLESSYLTEVSGGGKTTNKVVKAQLTYLGEEEEAYNIFNKIRNAEVERLFKIIKDASDYINPLINDLIEAQSAAE